MQICTLIYIGDVLVLFFVGWLCITALLGWLQGVSDDMHYGHPRTYQTDKDVGHGGVSHFIQGD